MISHHYCENLPEEYFFTHYQISEQDSAEFIQYNIKIFGVSLEDYASAMREIELDEKIIEKNIKKITEDIEKNIDKAKGNFGESQASYYLEKKENFIFTRYGWSENPFAGRTSIDIYGIDPSRKYVAYIEAKAAFSDASVAPLVSQLVNDQLHLERICSEIKRGPTKIQAISKAYQIKISKNISIEDPREIIDILYHDRFMRIGVIIHKIDRNHDHSKNMDKLYDEEQTFKEKNPRFLKVECFPTRIIDIKNFKIQEHFNHWLLAVDVLCDIRGY